MPKFRYKATEADGQETEGILEAKDRFEIYRQIRKKGRTVVLVEKTGGKGFSFLSLKNLNNKIGTVKTAERIIFTRNMAAMIEAGLTLSRALSVKVRQTNNPVFRKTLQDIGGDIKEGASLGDALAKFPKIFSPLFIAMVRAGEESGSLASALRTVGKQMDQSYSLQRKIKGALMYPAIIVIAMIIIGILMLMFVVPTLSQTFEELGADLPASTEAVIAVSTFLVENTFIAIGLLVVAAGGIVATFRTKGGRRAFESMILHIPIIRGLVKETNAARTARTFSSLLASGVEVVSALGITKDVVQNSHFKDVLGRAEKEIQKGAPISKIFLENDKLYPVLFSEIIAVGEETGKLSEMLEQVATFYEDEVSQKTKDMSTIIEPFLMIFIGVVVGFFALSMISPIYTLSDSI